VDDAGFLNTGESWVEALVAKGEIPGGDAQQMELGGVPWKDRREEMGKTRRNGEGCGKNSRQVGWRSAFGALRGRITGGP
jgi:hypothetical protein